MLDQDYQNLFSRLIRTAEDTIELPEDQQAYFEQSGPTASYPECTRQAQRTMVRTKGLMWCESPLPAFARPELPIVVYTRDFSKTGFGIVAPFQLYPGEGVRIVLATFWIRGTICRGRRIGASAFEAGAMLSEQCEPSALAFRRQPMAVA